MLKLEEMEKSKYIKIVSSADKNKCLDNEKAEIEKEIFILENRLSGIIGKLSIPSKKDNIAELDKEYNEILSKLKKLKNR